MSGRSIAVVAAHPDDEILGCGGTIAWHADAGDTVNVLLLAEGITSRDAQRSRPRRGNALAELAKAAQLANKLVGAKVTTHGFPDNRMDSVALLDVAKVVEAFLAKHSPSVVYTHWRGDLNVDHRVTHEAVLTACRPTPQSPVEDLLFFEVPSSTEWRPADPSGAFQPNWFVDISPTLGRKKSALEAYATEMRPFPHARSLQAVEALARWRGATAGVPAAEAFVLGRHIPRSSRAATTQGRIR
jgi:LmbE family N-acetylglucosaminyl deacetylase